MIARVELLADVLLAPTESAPAEARQVVRDALPPDVRSEIAYDVLLVVSELVTFKVGEERIGPDEYIGLRLTRGDVIRVEVRGAETPRPPDWPIEPWARVSALVANMATRSGVTQGDRVLAWADITP